VTERDVTEQQRHVVRRDLPDRGLADRADQHHRQHDGQDHDQRRTEVARELSSQSGIE
jgi:hypothetical protein